MRPRPVIRPPKIGTRPSSRIAVRFELEMSSPAAIPDTARKPHLDEAAVQVITRHSGRPGKSQVMRTCPAVSAMWTTGVEREVEKPNIRAHKTNTHMEGEEGG